MWKRIPRSSWIVLTFGAVLIMLDSPFPYTPSLGDRLMEALGLPSWTEEGRTGFHWTTMIGLILFAIGCSGATYSYRNKHPHILRNLLLASFLVAALFPYASEKVMYLIKFRSTGIHSLAMVDRPVACRYSTGDSPALTCSLSLTNYTGHKQIQVKPWAASHPGMPADVLEAINQVGPVTIALAPRSKGHYTLSFPGMNKSAQPSTGESSLIVLELEVDGEKTRIPPNLP